MIFLPCVLYDKIYLLDKGDTFENKVHNSVFRLSLKRVLSYI